MKKILFLLFALLFTIPIPVYAQSCGTPCPCSAPNTFCNTTLHICECNPGYLCTALGCIPTQPTDFVGWFLKIAIGLGGGIAFLLMVFGAIKVLTSSGNPEGVKAGQEMITSALSGLLFIIFSLFLLELIGVKILKIPEFSIP